MDYSSSTEIIFSQTTDIQQVIETPEEEFNLYFFQDKETFKWGYMNIEGKIIIEPKYDSAFYFVDGMARINIDRKVGFIDKNEEIVIPIIYDGASINSNGLFLLKEGEKWFYMNKDHEVILVLSDYTSVRNFSEGLATVSLIRNSFGCIDITGEYIIPPQYSSLGSFSEGLASFGVINENDRKYSFGFINKDNEIVIFNLYELVGSFSEGVACVKLNDKWGYINKKNKTIIDFIFDDANDFSEGVATVEVYGLWGVINHDGEFILNPQYALLTNCDNGLIAVYDDFEFIYYINLKGEIINPKQ